VDIGRQLGGGKGGGAATLEKAGLDLGQASAEFQAKTDDTGGDGGNGNKINNGGSGGDGDENDDDDYNDDGDDEARAHPTHPSQRHCATKPLDAPSRAFHPWAPPAIRASDARIRNPMRRTGRRGGIHEPAGGAT
jgi:hypothetical protein